MELTPFYHFEKNVKIRAADSLQFMITGHVDLIRIPPPSKSPSKIEGLYNTTCFEVFAMSPTGQYIEWNFSPSLDWCVFSFEKYRKKTTDLAGIETFSKLRFSKSSEEIVLSVELEIDLVKRLLNTDKLKVSCTAVIEFTTGKIEYYAFSHPSDKPDFHDPKGFLIEW